MLQGSHMDEGPKQQAMRMNTVGTKRKEPTPLADTATNADIFSTIDSGKNWYTIGQILKSLDT